MPQTFISQLLHEHIRIRRVLSVIERQFDRAQALETPDFRLLRDALVYLRDQPAHLHHHHEELMFKRLQLREPRLARDLDYLRKEHQRIYELEDFLKELVAQALTHGHAAVPRLLYFGRDYLRAQRCHSRFEEKVIFPLAAAVLKAEDWQSLARPAAEPGQPEDSEGQRRALAEYRALIPRLAA
jgi:hemerythrin-like domain-containing protein